VLQVKKGPLNEKQAISVCVTQLRERRIKPFSPPVGRNRNTRCS